MAANILIVGAGSVGKRHARNLLGLGCVISAMDPRVDRVEELAAELPLCGRYADLASALAAGQVNGVVIASPPSVHVAQALAALHAGIPVLLEKPVAPTLDAASELAETAWSTGVSVLLGYTWRWWPPFSKVWSVLRSGRLGTLRHVHFVLSAHLADWHPWERYQDFFMAKATLGGGALLDESHWLDLMVWFFGAPESVFARIEHISDLEITTDDNVDLLFNYSNGLRVSVHLDLYGRPHEKTIRFVGEKGTMVWTEAPNRVRIAHGAANEWTDEDFDCERNDMFLGVAREFLSILDTRAVPSCGLDDGLRVLRVIEAARLSHAESRLVALSEVSG